MNWIVSESDWVTISGWQTASFVGFNHAGLFRFCLHGSVVFVGYAAKSKPGLGARINAYLRGDDPDHHAAQQISRLKDELELQIVTLDHPGREIREKCHALRDKVRPTLNRKHPFRGRV